MNRRSFLQNVAAASAAHGLPLPAASSRSSQQIAMATVPRRMASPETADVAGHTLVSEFPLQSERWKVYEDLRTRDGAITFLSRSGARVLTKSAEASFSDSQTPYLGLSLKDIGTSPRDLLAERLLETGDDPDPERVKSAAFPLGSVPPKGPGWRLPWDTFVGTKQASDTMPVFPSGSTRTYHPVEFFPHDNRRANPQRWDGLLGGWMPAVRKVLPLSASAYYEVIVFGDVEAHDRFIVQTWHRTAHIEGGAVVKVLYGYSYPQFPPARVDPKPEDFYRALLVFAGYWDQLLADFAPASLPQRVWVDMPKHAFAKELMVLPGGL